MKGGAAFPVRVRYAKRGKVRWISHRDVARAFERAFRIGGLPLAFSQGFSPHPRVSFGLALSTGYESDAEYLDVEFAREVDLETLPGVLTSALPEGIAASHAVALDERAPALQEAVTAVEWSLSVRRADGAPLMVEELSTLVTAALAAPALPTTRRRKGREVIEDVRPVIRRFEVHEAHEGAVRGTIEAATQPRSAKPDEILAAVVHATHATGGLSAVDVLRTHQWIERDGARCEPHDADTRPRPEGRDEREGIDVRTPDVRGGTLTGAVPGH